ncbi:MAG: hypothetical protein SGI74_13560 [Oligoflexia bacterium]|nr:hypothetical protein [Oligoflexia bacterium]
MKLLTLCLLFIGIFFTQSSQAARYNSDCHGNSCMQYGWNVQQMGGHYQSNTQCVNGGCSQGGWQTYDNAGYQVSVHCYQGGCFRAGWSGQVFTNGMTYYEQGLCWGGNCLRNGWRIQTNWGIQDVVCLNGDCARFGWESRRVNGVSRTYCKNGDCFRFGWVTDVWGSRAQSCSL